MVKKAISVVILNPPFNEIVTEAEIEALQALYTQHSGAHPLVSVALHPEVEELGQIADNTCRALRYVLREFRNWARSLKPRLLDARDCTNAESALGEIRACGALVEAEFPVQLGSKNAASGAKPEFLILMDGVETIIEVWTRNLRDEEKAQIKDQQTKSSRSEQLNGGTITTSIAAHPTADFPLTASFRKQILKLPWFDIGLSLANWSEGLVEKTVRVQRDLVLAVVRALGFSG